MGGGGEKARGWGAEAPLTARVEQQMASSAWRENVEPGLTSNEFVKRVPVMRASPPRARQRLWIALALHSCPEPDSGRRKNDAKGHPVPTSKR